MDFSFLNIKIEPLDSDIMAQVRTRLDNLSKPLGSLGKLESYLIRLGGITKSVYPDIGKKCIVVMCSDNGVVEEGVSSCPKSVTSAVTRNFTRGIACVNTLSRHSKSDLLIVDIGVDDDFDQEIYPQILNRKIRKGTSNIAKGPAMTRQEAIRSIETGREIVRDLKEKGYRMLAAGEMGIGNTTTSSAVSAALLKVNPERVIGIGSGLTKQGLMHKIEIVKKSLEINRPDPEDPIDVLAKVGGFDIGGMAGCMIGAAENRIPFMIDGFIAAAAALIAVRIEPRISDYLFPSHGSSEPGASLILKEIGMEPFLNLDMRVGEGTGAALGFLIFDAAIVAYSQMGTFEDANIDKYLPLED